MSLVNENEAVPPTGAAGEESPAGIAEATGPSGEDDGLGAWNGVDELMRKTSANARRNKKQSGSEVPPMNHCEHASSISNWRMEARNFVPPMLEIQEKCTWQ
jgi:hypothetical protein